MNGRNLVLTGVPRGGTTLACRLLGQAEDCVSLFEPMAIDALPHARAAAVDAIVAYFADVRAEMAATGFAPSKQHAGRVPDNLFGEPTPGIGRTLHARPGRVPVPRARATGTLVIKHNAAFTALLPELAAALPVFAIVRDPRAVLASWCSVDLPVRQGRVPAGERFDPSLRARLDACADRLQRQLYVLDWCFTQFAEHLPAAQVLTYEALIDSHGRSLYDAVGVRGHPDTNLRRRDPARLCSAGELDTLARAIRQYPGAWRRWYP